MTAHTADDSESTPLLRSQNRATGDIIIKDPPTTTELKKSLTLSSATIVIIGCMAGTGIFISPIGVTQGVGSVGASLIIWTVAGLFSLVLAFCYAELGTALPESGGDYLYVQRMFGSVAGFVCVWSAVIMAASAAALMARAFSLYLFSIFALDCHPAILMLTGVWIQLSFIAMNCVTVTWSTRLLGLFSVIKILALVVIIITGVVIMFQSADNFKSPFAGTSTNVGSWATGFIAGFVSYGGWESVNTMAGEMKNPKRDLPLSLVIAVAFITAIYVLTNTAYFSVLNPPQFITSDAVAMTWAQKALPPQVTWIMPLGVAMAAAGSVNAMFLLFPRYVYAAGKGGQLPALFSYLHIRHFTPVPAVVFIAVLSFILTCLTFINIQGLIQVIGVLTQIKQVLALLSLLRLKRVHPNIPRTVVVPSAVVVIALIILLGVTAISMYQSPVSNVLAVVMSLSGLPLYFLGRMIGRNNKSHDLMDVITSGIQRLLLVVP